MSRTLRWFAARPVLTLLLVTAYFAAVVTSHDRVQELAYWLQQTFTREVWSPVVALLALVTAGGLGWRAFSVLRGAGRPRSVAVAWWGSLAAAVAASAVLLATNMETVHFLQYALLAVPVLALSGRCGATVLLVTALGAFDELYQWTVLHAGWAVRFDTNDVVLNGIGAALGCAAAAVFAGVRPARDVGTRVRAATWGPVLAVTLVVGAGGPALAARHRLAMYREDWCPHAWMTLSRLERPATRWQQPEGARRHHELHPGVMLALCVALAAGFCALDDRWRVEGVREGDAATAADA